MHILEALIDAGVVSAHTGVEVTRLAGGFWNEVVRLDLDDGRRLVAKRFTTESDNPYFPVDPDLEAAATALLAGTQIAAEPIAYLPEQRVLVTRYLDGAAWDGDVEGVGRLLRRVHAIPPRRLRPLAVGTGAVLEHARRILEWGGARLAASPPGEHHPGSSGALVHTDCGPGNIISTIDGPRLVDWQCPGDGDPVEDLSCFASPAMQLLYDRQPLTDEQTARLLAAYDDAATTQRFHEIRLAYHWRIAAYCVARATRLSGSDPRTAARYRTALAAELRLLEELR